jgi:hypothetical protein
MYEYGQTTSKKKRIRSTREVSATKSGLAEGTVAGVDDEWPPPEARVQAALWDAERSLERREYLVATSRLADAFGLAGNREELVRGLHHLGAAGYRAQTGEPIRARRQLGRARARLAPFPEAAPLIDLVARDIESAGGELAEP